MKIFSTGHLWSDKYFNIFGCLICKLCGKTTEDMAKSNQIFCKKGEAE